MRRSSWEMDCSWHWTIKGELRSTRLRGPVRVVAGPSKPWIPKISVITPHRDGARGVGVLVSFFICPMWIEEHVQMPSKNHGMGGRKEIGSHAPNAAGQG